MKTVAFYSYVPKLHSVYNSIIDHPPEGYRYAVSPFQRSKALKSFFTNPGVKDFARWTIGKHIDTVHIRDHLYRVKRFPEHDLLYSTGFLCLRNEPWIVDMEFPSTFTGYDMARFERRKEEIARVLSGKWCKRVIPWTESASEVMRRCFPAVAHKVVAVPNVVPVPHVKRTARDGKVRLLFMGSANLPRDFEIKGGPEALEAYASIARDYDDVEFIVRCYVTPELKARYEGTRGLRIIDALIPWREVQALYANADAFVGVFHHTPCLAHLEAMSYGLPVIATDVWENERIVGGAGLLVPKHARAPYFARYGMPDWGSEGFLDHLKIPDKRRVRAIAQAMRSLIEDSALRRRLGRAAKAKVTKGPYSIAARNRLLKEVYDEATS